MQDEEAEKKQPMSSKERAAANDLRNLERKQEREAASTALVSGNVNLQEIVRQGGSLGRRLEREIRRFEQTGRVSSWLAGETLKTEAAQNAAQQSAFKQAVLDVVKSSPSDAFDISPTLPSLNLITRKPEIPEEAAAAATCIGLALYVKNGNVWIGAGTVNGELPSGFDPIDGKSIANGGSGYVWVEIEIDPDNGVIEDTNFESGGNIPANTDTTFIYTLGYYEYNGDSPSVTNYGCGGITAVICRNWFATKSPFYGLTSITRSTI